jgi:hypothetical protein
VQTIDLSHQFESFLSLGQGLTISITDENASFLLSLSREFRNSELCIFIMDRIQRDLTISKALDSISDLDFPSERSVAFLALHFCELTSSDLDAICCPRLFHILSHESLRISSEEALYDYVYSRALLHSECFGLFQFVRFEYLSTDYISRFVSMSCENFDLVDLRIWCVICERLILRVLPPGANPRARENVFPMVASDPLNGIIAYLTRKHSGNVRDKEVISISSKSESSDDPVRNALDLRPEVFFWSRDEPDQWICWDFHEMRVRPTHYSIRSGRWANLKSWVVVGSLDGEHWNEIDRRLENEELNEYCVVRPFPVSKPIDCRFVKLTQLGKNHGGFDYLVLSFFELFGALLE